MSEEIKQADGITPIIPTVIPAKQESSGVKEIDLATADLTALKSAFESALAERAAIDTKINSLRKAIAGRLKEFQSLNDKVSNQIGRSNQSIIRFPSINWGKLWSFTINWLVPAVILFAILWVGVKAVKTHYTMPNDGKIPIEQSIIPGHNVRMNIGVEQWS